MKESGVQVVGGRHAQVALSRELKSEWGFPGWRSRKSILAEGTARAKAPWQEGASQELKGVGAAGAPERGGVE